MDAVKAVRSRPMWGPDDEDTTLEMGGIGMTARPATPEETARMSAFRQRWDQGTPEDRQYLEDHVRELFFGLPERDESI